VTRVKESDNTSPPLEAGEKRGSGSQRFAHHWLATEGRPRTVN
jgi:hypothetical protein